MTVKCALCDQHGAKRCSGCQTVFYCSAVHQKEHWKKHKRECRSRIFTVKSHETYGRHLVAARDIEPGTIIMNELPIMIGPRQDTLPICLGCHKKLVNPVSIYYCSGCLLPMCGPECEKVPIHAENECAVFSKNLAMMSKVDFLTKNHPIYEPILTIRCLLLKEKEPKKWEQLNKMEHHNDHRKTMMPGLWQRNQLNTVIFLREKMKLQEYDEVEIHSVLGYSDVNSFLVKTNEIEILGLYNNCYLMAHHCSSNTHHVINEDHRMIVRAAIPIKKGDMITTSYTSALEGTLRRRELLQESKFFKCTCARCVDPTELGTYFSAVKCGKCPKNYLLPLNPLDETSIWICNNNTCTNRVSIDTIQELLAKISDAIADAANQAPIQMLEAYEMILNKYSGTVVHPNHYLMCKLLHALSQLYGRLQGIENLSMDGFQRKKSYCERFLRVVDIIEPGMSRLRGMTLYELQAAIYFSAKNEFKEKASTPTELKERLETALELLEESIQILSFDPPYTTEGGLAVAGPLSIQAVKAIIVHL